MSETVGDLTLAFKVTDKTPVIRFLASLSDGRTVIQDDLTGKKHAWSRLATWLKNNPGITITGLRLQGTRGFEVKMPANQQGYFFGNKLQAVWGGPQFDYSGIGYYKGHVVNICWYKKPIFDSSFTEERTVEKAGFFLIKNSYNGQE